MPNPLAAYRAVLTALVRDWTRPDGTCFYCQPPETHDDCAACAARFLISASTPVGWRFEHERQAELLQRDGLMCEAHPGLPFEHDQGCAGPGMPWCVEGRLAVEALRGA